MDDKLALTMKRYRGAKRPEQFMPYFNRIPEIVALRKTFRVQLESQASAMSARTQWYAFVKSLQTYQPDEDLTIQARSVIARAKDGMLEFVHREKTDLAEAFKAAMKDEGGDSLDRAYDSLKTKVEDGT